MSLMILVPFICICLTIIILFASTSLVTMDRVIYDINQITINKYKGIVPPKGIAVARIEIMKNCGTANITFIGNGCIPADECSTLTHFICTNDTFIDELIKYNDKIQVNVHIIAGICWSIVGLCGIVFIIIAIKERYD